MAPQTSKLTYEDYARLPADGLRHEIIDGKHFVNAAPNLLHQTILLNIAVPMRLHVRRHQLGAVYVAPADVVLSTNDVLQPDIAFVRTERRSILTTANVQGAPDLVIEILSPSNRQYDEVVKRKRYDSLGVAEYWIVDPERETVKVYRRAGNLVPVACGDPLTTPLLPGFSITFAQIFDPM
jgi:Uma2 family endonuclease